MKRKTLWKKAFATVMSASMLMTSVVPEAMVYGAEEEMPADAWEAQSEDEPLEAAGFEDAGAEEPEGQEEAENGQFFFTDGTEEEEQLFGSLDQEDAVRMDLVETLNARIEKLPSVEEFQNLEKEEQDKVLEEVNDIADQYYDQLSEEEQALVQAEKLVEMLEYMSGQVDELAESGYTSDDSDYMEWAIGDIWKTTYKKCYAKAIKIKGKYNGEWLKTTYGNYGFMLMSDGFSESDVNVEISPAFKYDGRFIEVTYKVTALSAINGKLGVVADTQVGGNESTGVDAIRENGTAVGFQMKDKQTGACVQIYYGGKRLTSKANTHWAGLTDNVWNNWTTTQDDYSTSKDTAVAFTWNVNLQKGKSQEYKMLVGVGSENDLSESMKVKVNCISEEIVNLLPNQKYMIDDLDNNKYYVIYASANGVIPFEGKVDSGWYDLRGRKIRVTLVGSSEKYEFDLSYPKVTKLTDADVTISNNVITVKGAASQEYVLLESPDLPWGDLWKNAKTVDGDRNNIKFTETTDGNELNDGEEYIIYTRVPATTEHIASGYREYRLTFDAHEHNWSYKLSEDKSELKASCAGCGEVETLTLSLVNNDQVLESLTYGDSYTVALTGNEELNLEASEIAIYKASAPGAVSGGELQNAVPTDAGDYYAEATLTAGGEKYTVVKAFTIGKKQLTAEVYYESKSYDGKTTVNATATVETGIDGQILTISGLTGKLEDKNAGEDKAVKADNSKVEVMGKDGTNPENYEITYPDGTATVFRKELEAGVAVSPKEYNGQRDAQVTATVETGIDGETLEITGVTGEFEDANVGENKEVTIDSSKAVVMPEVVAKNYWIFDYPSTATGTIQPRPVQLKWSATDLTYTGEDQSVTANVENVVGEDKVELTYENNTASAVDSYTAKVTGLSNENYTLENAKNVTTDWSISYLPVEETAIPTPSGDKKEGSEWYTGDVTLTPGNGYLISRDGETWSDTLSIKDEGENEISYYLKDKDGHITGVQHITVKKDTAAPAGEIKVADSSVTASDKAGTYFFKDTAKIQISGTDATSGIAKVEYQIVSKAKGEEYKEDGTWIEGNAEGTSIDIAASENCVVYARITDAAGNVTIVHSGDIVVYKEVTGSGKSDYTRTTGQDMVTDVAQNGNTVKEVKNGDTVLKKDVDYVINKDGNLVIRSEYLEKLPAGEHELTVSWNPNGTKLDENVKNPIADSTIKVTVKRADPSKAEAKITNTGKFSKTYDGQPAEKVTSESKNSSSPVVEYKKKDASDDTYTTEVPNTAGSYVVRVTYPQNENYEASVVTEEFTIAPKEIGIQWGETEFIANGKEQAPTAAATGLLGSDQCEITVDGAQTEAGKYTATAVSLSNSNYCLPKDGTTVAFEIKPAFDKKASVLALNKGLKVSQTGSALSVKWGKVKGADGYQVYVQYCGSKFTGKSLNLVKDGSKTSLTVKKINGKKLNLKKNFKVYVEAYKNVGDEKVVMGSSILAHVAGRQNSKYTNVKGIKLAKSSFTLKRGKSAAIKATTVKVYSNRKQLSNGHAKELRYATSNASVAKVNASGKITAVGKGSCTIYVYARNGYAKKVKVTVK